MALVEGKLLPGRALNCKKYLDPEGRSNTSGARVPHDDVLMKQRKALVLHSKATSTPKRADATGQPRKLPRWGAD